MKTVTVLLVALVLSNLLLAGLLIWERTGVSVLPAVQAQTVSRGGKYLAATANISSNRQCVYLIDEKTDRMIVFLWDEPKKMLRALAYRNLADLFRRGDSEENKD